MNVESRFLLILHSRFDPIPSYSFSSIKALEKAGYTLAATTLKALMRVDLAGAFDAISVGNPTDVAGLLWRKRDEFLT
ncbi:MAG: hypothetical protein QMD92_08165 [bacterium]|nr:hypothetical protein [bacterium]